ncbi:MAG: peptide-N4-(N-acetyl-beta- glucosaminyl)asparagine amidase [Piccolia ochrophora]|nr:MAG: peptide-N4-(N-acetyl-beta- glucosaminyl)asparagine amidase [Piccolia ochrophora]
MSVNTSERSSLSQEQTRFSGPGFSSFTPRSLGNIPAVAMQRIFKPQWPDPERSIGDEYTPLISKTRTMKRCWAARGPAADAFAEICPELESLLNYRDDLDDQEDQSQIWAFTCCMIGRHQGRARPSIILHCRQTSICQKAIGIIMETKWWKSFKQKYPAFTFTIRSCAPRPIELADEVTLSNFQGLAGDVFAPGFKQSASNCCGLPIFILLPDGNSSSNQRLKSPDRNSSSLYRQATMGGIVRVGNELRGLTVAHSFHILSQDDAIIDEEEEVTFFDDESEDEAIDATSIDSIMGDVDKKDDADQVKGQGKNKPRTRSSKLGSQSSESSANSNPDTSIFTTLPDFDAPRLGRLVESSYQHANNTLDWAIFSIERPLDIDSNFVLNTGRQPFRLKRIVEIAPSSDSCWRQSQDVCVAKKENEIVTGRMACAKFFLRLPGRPGFAETRQLLLSEPLGWYSVTH